LTGNGRTERDAGHLVDLIYHLFIYIDQFVIPSSSPTLPADSLAERMERYQFHHPGFDHRAFLFHLSQHLFEGDERFTIGVIDVGLIDLVRHEDQAMIVTKPDDLPHLRLFQTTTGRITRVDDDDRFQRRPLLLTLGDRTLQDLQGQTPTLPLVQLVPHRLAPQRSERGGIKGILGNRDQNPFVRSQRDPHDLSHPGRSSGSEEDGFVVRRIAVPFFQISGDSRTNGFDPLGMGVGSYGTDFRMQLSGSGDGIGGVDLGGQGVVKEVGVF
jgi:hypothetical protein